MSDRVAEARAPFTLMAAAVLVWLQATGEIVYVGWRSAWTIGLRIFVGLILALQLLFAYRVLRFSAGAILALFAFEAMTVVGAIGSDAPIAIRIVLALSAIITIALLAASITAFPSPTLPRGPLP